MSGWLRNAWYVAMWSQDLEPGQVAARTILEEPIALCRRHDGEVFAVEDRCPHRSAPLHLGRILPSGALQCAYHGLEFDGSGACVRNPHGTGRIPQTARVRSYPVVERHTLVWVWMGETAPRPELIPDYRMFDPESGLQISKRDHLRMPAYYELITENLLDLSHVSFLHHGILGNDETISAETEVQQAGDTITVSRRMPNVTPPGLFDRLFRNDGQRVDLWFSMRWNAPACLLNDAGATAPGASRQEGTGILGAHILTPETATSTLYHFAAARQNPISRGAEEDVRLRTELSDLRRYAFEEQDQPVICAQQQAILQARQPIRPVLLDIDAGAVRASRVLARMRAAERSEAAAASD